MGLLVDVHQSVNIPKPDFLSMVANAAPGNINGCLHCKRTIFFNGANWNHANDRPECEDTRHVLCWIPNRTVQVEVARTVWKGTPITKPGPVSRCSRCGEETPAYWGPYAGWSYARRFNCKAAVATPAAKPFSLPSSS